jgi:predicted methyltransferase
MKIVAVLSFAFLLFSPAGNALADEHDIYADATAAESRLPGDRERDAGRKPEEVLAFFGIGRGDKVLDMFSGGGYYTELLSQVVGPEGRVVAHMNTAYLSYSGEQFVARYKGARLPNVDILFADNNRLHLEPLEYDAVLMVLSYHDVYYVDPENGWPELDVNEFLSEIHRALKPGGVLGIVDHYAEEGSPPETGETLHRIDPGLVLRDLTRAGFVLDEASDILRNPADDHGKPVFDPAVRGKTDRFVMRFRKPD